MSAPIMSSVPFLGRLFFREYLALFGSLILVALEVVVRVITLALPERIIRFLYNQSKGLFNILSSPQSQRSRSHRRRIVNPIAQAADFVDLCALSGYYAEEHVVQTKDGYLLGVHRLGWRRGEEDQRVNSGTGSLQKKVVYLHHGLMMNSEVWVCLSEHERCLPFALVDKGYDVWLGNNRGNKYSKKNVHNSPSSTAFWNFSIDQFAFHDIPDTINYILSTTQQPSLSYVGFSQGTAQAFATLSIHPILNDKIDVFVALAPAMSPPGLANGIVASLVKTSPEVLFLAFGRRSILSSSTMWQALLYPPIFVRFIDISLSFLFGWHTQNITPHQKLAAYPHLYSFASTKCVVHWFQIIRTGAFQMFDDEVQGPMSVSGGRRYYKVAKFPTRNIKTPIVLVYGGSDSLVDINVMLKELPKHTIAQEIPHYEHLDFLWASDVDTQVFPAVFDALEFHTHGDATNKLGRGLLVTRPLSSPTQPPSYSEEDDTVVQEDKIRQIEAPAMKSYSEQEDHIVAQEGQVRQIETPVMKSYSEQDYTVAQEDQITQIDTPTIKSYSEQDYTGARGDQSSQIETPTIKSYSEEEYTDSKDDKVPEIETPTMKKQRKPQSRSTSQPVAIPPLQPWQAQRLHSRSTSAGVANDPKKEGDGILENDVTEQYAALH